jgi:hypothetical protein
MTQKGILDTLILATHLIQEANYNHKSLQLISFDIEGSRCIHAPRAFGIPETIIMAIQHYSLIGYDYVEVNGKTYLENTQKESSLRTWRRRKETLGVFS